MMFGAELVAGVSRVQDDLGSGRQDEPGQGRRSESARLQPQHRPGLHAAPRPYTIFQFPDDDCDFGHAARRCFGVGECRELDGGTMCPSYRATREEEHSTRGRARLLFEMLRGEVDADGWRDRHIKEALDLCLACKGCKGECPVNVDMATYKAEFLSHYYEGRTRPPAAYAMGLIDKWAQLASLTPSLANLATQTPGFASIARKLGGITPHRDLPAFPPQTFKNWLAKRSSTSSSAMNVRGEVILWADTFNNYLSPHTSKAAVEVLEHAGFRVNVPQQHLCCGRPLYDFGMLDEAKTYLRTVLKSLAPEIAAGTPIICLEPSCASVFHDELINLFPNDEAAKKLQKQIILFPDFLERVGYRPAQGNPQLLGNKAVIHGHCHHKALWSISPEEKLLREAGLQPQVLDSGCCGLAGSFGYEAEHYDISMKIGERVLFSSVRSAAPDTIIVADGFSCRQQISHGTSRRGMHLAEVLQMGLRPSEQRPKRVYIEDGHTEPKHGLPKLPILTLAGLASAAGLFLLLRKRRPNTTLSKHDDTPEPPNPS